jgi:hypothetical protein
MGRIGGRSALLILVRVALLLPSDDEPVPAFTFPGPGIFSAVAEASASSFRRQAQPSKEHFAVAGVCRFPSVLPSGFRLRPFRQSGFHLSGPTCFPLKVRRLPSAFRAGKCPLALQSFRYSCSTLIVTAEGRPLLESVDRSEFLTHGSIASIGWAIPLCR